MKDKAIVNPEILLNEGVVYSASTPIDRKEQLQQVGVDLRLNKVYKVVGDTTLKLQKADCKKASFVEVVPDEDGVFHFEGGELYNVDFIEDVKVPAGVAGFVKQRSTINRTIGTVESGWYDSGFESKGGCGAVFRPLKNCSIEHSYRLGQIVFWYGDNATMYDGQYQNT